MVSETKQTQKDKYLRRLLYVGSKERETERENKLIVIETERV
jgi:hypothetical protein